MALMKAVVVHEAGGPEVLRIESRPVPAPKPGEVLIRPAVDAAAAGDQIHDIVVIGMVVPLASFVARRDVAIEIARATALPLGLPTPRNPRLLRAVAALRANPADPRRLEKLADLAARPAGR